MSHRHYIKASWPVPAGVSAVSTTRVGGVSLGPWQGLNLADNVGDQATHVALNRQCLADDLSVPSSPRWIRQVHGGDCIPFERALPGGQTPADAIWSDQPGQVCVIQTADCLPILLCDQTGSKVAAVHAGWRGVVAGVIENTVNTMGIAKGAGLAWLGPAISQMHFELGGEVYQQFVAQYPKSGGFFIERHGRYYLDLAGLAKAILEGLGITCYGGDYCTYSKEEWFYSYRRQTITGRQVSLIWRD